MERTTILEQRSFMKNLNIVFFIVLLSTMACEKNVKSGGGVFESPTQNTSIEPQRTINPLVGIYTAPIKSLNSSLASHVRGEVVFEVSENDIEVRIEVKNTSALVTQYQSMYEGMRCPDERDDLNGDGYLDPVEVSKVVGKILIPLDADIENQSLGFESFPGANLFGNYSYENKGKLSVMLADLYAADDNFEDDIVKTNKHNFSFHKRVVLLQGVNSIVYLPASLEALEGKDLKDSITVGCAEIKRL